ncbi:phage exclusion protein Lit family protein [Providencia rettgeri]|uniref:phage exclusion protein Lit family protein n=1 Tax=Providencia rettgeri TaxID=587 RepID=UPI0023AB2C64|nr:phage exclusion protein Lit family protein [Providencia rettgeri]
MKRINHYNISHRGYLPVRVLQHNIISQFENTSADFLERTQKTIALKWLSKEIAYVINKSSTEGEMLKGPFVSIDNKEINIQETFLAYLWCVTYSLFIYTDLIIEQKVNLDSKRKTLAIKSLEYALSLIEKYSDWNKGDLPNPECYLAEDAGDIEKTNELFLYGLNFIICHEFSHVDLDHCCKFETDGFLSDLEKKEFELSADENAINLLRNGIYPNNETATKIGVAIALSSLLFFNSKVSRKIHPDSDTRIINALEKLEVDDNEQSWIVACAAINLWANINKISLEWDEKSSFKELINFLSVQLE